MGKVRAVDVGQRLRLVPYWERRAAPSDRIDLIIDPGPAFGAGDHPTTIMALELLEAATNLFATKIDCPSLLDVGTGTGVLAIAGKALGSGFTVAFDPDPTAVFSARHNCQLNGLWGAAVELNNGIRLLVGGIESIKGTFDIVAANLIAPLLLKLSGQITDRVGRLLVLSGIADPMANRVTAAFQSAGLNIVERLHKDGWNSALFSR
jgi:ribosomal protein L11 methyltransferase